MDKDAAVSVVQLDALVAVKIVKHCREALPTLAMGQLLGLDVGARLEVTHAFPVPSGRPTDDDGNNAHGGGSAAANANASEEYQVEMMRLLREVNVDNNAIGWYQSTYLGSFIGSGMLESQFSYQANIGKSVVIVYGTPAPRTRARARPHAHAHTLMGRQRFVRSKYARFPQIRSAPPTGRCRSALSASAPPSWHS